MRPDARWAGLGRACGYVLEAVLQCSHRSRVTATVLASAALCVLTHCAQAGPEADAIEQPEPVILGPESVAFAREQTLTRGPRLSGSLVARERATVVAESSGSILELEAELGDAVQRGQVLVRIDQGELLDRFRAANAAIRSARAALRVAQQQMQRTATLVEAGARAERDLELDRAEVERAQAEVQEARASLATLRDQLRATVVRAPFDGVISAQPAYEGDVVRPGTPLLTLIDPSSVRLEASVPSEHLPLLAVGKRVDFQVRGHPGRVFEGQIAAIAPAANPSTRQVRIVVEIPNPNGALLAGLYAEGRLIDERRTALAVPAAAVDLVDPGEAAVTVVRDGEARRVPVALGMTDEVRELVEIRSGVRAGEPVVTGPARGIAPGTPMEVVRPPTKERSDASPEQPEGGLPQTSPRSGAE